VDEREAEYLRGENRRLGWALAWWWGVALTARGAVPGGVTSAALDPGDD
jgi:hypothetical protein